MSVPCCPLPLPQSSKSLLPACGPWSQNADVTRRSSTVSATSSASRSKVSKMTTMLSLPASATQSQNGTTAHLNSSKSMKDPVNPGSQLPAKSSNSVAPSAIPDASSTNAVPTTDSATTSANEGYLIDPSQLVSIIMDQTNPTPTPAPMTSQTPPPSPAAEPSGGNLVATTTTDAPSYFETCVRCGPPYKRHFASVIRLWRRHNQ